MTAIAIEFQDWAGTEAGTMRGGATHGLFLAKRAASAKHLGLGSYIHHFLCEFFLV